MHIRVLGCSGSIAAGNRTTSFLVDDHVLVDAGTGVGDLTLQEMARIDHIFVTHSHLDHVLAIGLLADTVTRQRQQRGCPPIRVHGLQATLDALRQHVLNGVIWPDFTRLPEPAAPVLALQPVLIGERVAAGPIEVEVLPASHTVPAVGYAVRRGDASGAWVFTGDTGPNPALWQRLAAMTVSSLVIETAFRNDERALAGVSRHLCPSLLHEELQQLEQPTDVYITHIKPGEIDTVMAEVDAVPTRHRIRALQQGWVMEV